MLQRPNPTQFKQSLAEFFNERRHYDDEGDFHPRIAQRLIDYACLQPGQKVLDIATGTGLAAIAAAQQIAPDGWVVGVDLSEGMLNQAKRKIETLQLFNISLDLADAETLYFPEHCFDVVLCSSALVYLTDIPTNLRQWHKFLKPGGLVGFHGFSEDSFVVGVTTQKIAQRYGISLVFNQPTGTEQRCRSLLQAAGFGNITVYTEQFGDYISLETAKQLWNPGSKNPMIHPLRQLSPQQLEQAKQEYVAELVALQTDRGIWNNILTFFAFGQKIET
ncbi:MAG: methyltransferase domain-containing protein [Leptolyngbyaceae cyanobacterium bins.302]|nr:methyltransferase domain-containing protein [Leptolyngbyaceae cyanobacterium bins.302]